MLVCVAKGHPRKELHPSEWDLDFDVGGSFLTLFQDGDQPHPMPEHVHISVDMKPERTVSVGTTAQWHTLIFMVVTTITLAIGAMLVHGVLMTCRTYVRTLKHDNKLSTALPAHATCVLGLICAATLCSMFMRQALHNPVAEDVVLMAGGAQYCGINSTSTRGLEIFHIRCSSVCLLG